MMFQICWFLDTFEWWSKYTCFIREGIEFTSSRGFSWGWPWLLFPCSFKKYFGIL